MPDSAHTTSSRPGAWTSRRISAETMKIPEPIIDPTTSAVASSRESALTKSACGCWVVAIWRGNLVAPGWGRYVLGPHNPPSSEGDRASLAPGRRVLRPVRRGGYAEQGSGAAAARPVRSAPRTPHSSGRSDQAAGARSRPDHARGGEPARSNVHHAARSRGHPPARVRSGRRDGRDRRHRPPLSDLSPGARSAGREGAHRGDPADGGRARRGRRPPQEGRRRDEVLHRGEKTRGRRRRDLPRGARSHVRDRAGRPRDHQVEGDLRQPRNDARPGRRRRQRAGVHHHQARLMVHSAWFVLAIVLVALAFDFINGFHDAANSIATVVSTRVLTPSAAVIWAAAFNFIAVFIFGTAVAKTMGKGLVDLAVVDATVILAGLIGAIVWDLITWWLGLPTSSSHALIGGYGGAAVAKAGVAALLFPGKWIATLVFIVVAPVMGLTLALALTVALSWALRRSLPRRVDRVFRVLQLGSAAAYSLGHGSNDAQKTMGIIVGLLVAERQVLAAFPVSALHLTDAGVVPAWVIIACGAAMGLGTMSGGWRIVKTMGQRLTKLTPFGGFCAETSGAITLFIASHFGIPVSTTHTITGAISGVGAAHRLSAVRWGVAGRIVWAWLLTIPASAGIAGSVYFVLRALIR